MQARAHARWSGVVAVMAMAAAVMPSMAGTAHADVDNVPAPDAGCIAAVAESFASGGNDPSGRGRVDLTVPGTIERVIVEWVGRDDANLGVSALNLEVVGPHGSLHDPARTGTVAGTDNTRLDGRGENIYSWWADVTDLFGAGTAGNYTVDVARFATRGIGIAWGGTVTVVYDTTPCGQTYQAMWNVGVDHYFGGHAASSGRTDLIVFDWEGANDEDMTVTLRTTHAGADSETQRCRVSSVWAAAGAGPAPAATDTLVDRNGNPARPGAARVVVNPFTPPGQSCPPVTFNAPAVGVRGGSVGPEFALVEIDILVPAGAEWLAFQLESPADNGGHRGLPESGAWGGAALLLIPSLAAPAPDIVVEKTVLDGAGGACPAVEGVDEAVAAEAGDVVTYCYRITNPGTTPLFPVTLHDDALDVDSSDMRLVRGDPTSPLLIGGEHVFAFETVVAGDQRGTVTATGVPSDAAGADRGLDIVSATDDAAVVMLQPAIRLEHTILPGHGAACPGVEGTDELVVGAAGTPVTYCFRIVNQGNVALASIELVAPDLGLAGPPPSTDAGDSTSSLAPLDSVVWSHGGVISADVTTSATVTAVAADPRIGATPVTATDTAAVGLLDAAIRLDKTVGPVDSLCAGEDGADVHTGLTGAEVLYCYAVTNTGAVPLYPITIDDPDLGTSDTDMTLVAGSTAAPLLPGETVVLSYADMIAAHLTSTATATGTISDAGGAPTGAGDVTHRDTAEVRVVVPGLELHKTVVAGHDGECAAGTDDLTVEPGAPVMFCFRIVNTGESALSPIVLTDVTFGVTSADMDLIDGDAAHPLQPGDELVYSWRTAVSADVVNLAVVTGTPADADGVALDSDVTLTAQSSVHVAVTQVPPAPVELQPEPQPEPEPEPQPEPERLPATGAASNRQTGFGIALLAMGAALAMVSQGRLTKRPRRRS
jgi:hypothetical protein